MLTLSLSEDDLHLSPLFDCFIPTTKGLPCEAYDIINSRCNRISETFRCSYFSNMPSFLHIWFKALQKTNMGMFWTAVPEKIHRSMLHGKEWQGIQGLYPVGTLPRSTICIVYIRTCMHVYLHRHALTYTKYLSMVQGHTYKLKKWQYLPARAAIICSEVGSG